MPLVGQFAGGLYSSRTSHSHKILSLKHHYHYANHSLYFTSGKHFKDPVVLHRKTYPETRVFPWKSQIHPTVTLTTITYQTAIINNGHLHYSVGFPHLCHIRATLFHSARQITMSLNKLHLGLRGAVKDYLLSCKVIYWRNFLLMPTFERHTERLL